MDDLDWARCGTEANYGAHRRRGEIPCEPCKKAASRAHADRRQRRLQDQSLCAEMPHGKASSYHQGCRCVLCTAANTLEHREAAHKRRRKQQGTGPSARIRLLPLEGVRRARQAQ